MPIKLPSVEHKTIEQLRKERYDSYKSVSKKLRDSLESICENHRIAYEMHLYEQMCVKLQKFLEKRKPNQTAEEYYMAVHGIDANYKPDRRRGVIVYDKRQWVAEDLNFIMPLIDHPIKESFSNYQEWSRNKDRTAFVVKMLPTALPELKRRAKEQVDRIIEIFVYKVTDKVLDLLVAHPEYNCELKYGAFRASGFEGDVILKFEKVKFRMHVILKYNSSVYGTPYVQYPLTFHDFVMEGKEKRLVSENELYDLMGIIPWKPIKSKKPWEKLVLGDIVELKTGRIVIVSGIKSPVVKIYSPGDGEKQVSVEAIKFIHAHTKPTEVANDAVRGQDVSWHLSRLPALYVEMFSGRCQKFPLDSKYCEEWKDDSHEKKGQKTRLLGFQLVLGSWDNLMLPYEPKKFVRRRF